MMEGLIGGKPIVPGIRFNPTDEELCMYYLKRKVLGKSLEPQMIGEVNVYQFAPWELPALSSIKTKDLKWYFFSPRKKMYPNGKRPHRATKCGYWKATGKDRSVSYKSQVVGKIKTLIFYRGKAPNGERTNWVIHEYVLEDCVVADKGVPNDAYVICQVYEKSGSGPKNGEDYGAPFVEEEWESDDDGLALSELGQGSDASGSVLTSAALTSPDSVAVGAANAGSTNSTFAAAAANAGSPNSTFATATSAGSRDPAFAGVATSGSPDSTLAAAGTPCTTADTVGGAPTTSATIVTAASVGTAANVVAATLADLLEDEIDIMLSNFTEDHMEGFGNIFDDLEDLYNFSTHKEIGSNNLFIGLDEM